MRITINQTVNGLDPNSTSENGAESLKNYIAEVTAEIHKQYPNAWVIHKEVDETYAFRVDTDQDDHLSHMGYGQSVQEIIERVYECGNFWA